jgi:cobyrinic acid a,c-diamide synthase
MTGRLTLGYREAIAATATPWLDAGERVRGHEFHYTQVEPKQAQVEPGRATGGAAAAAWTLSARGSERAEGYARDGVQASYLHVHWAAHPQLASRFAHAARAAQPAVA